RRTGPLPDDPRSRVRGQPRPDEACRGAEPHEQHRAGALVRHEPVDDADDEAEGRQEQEEPRLLGLVGRGQRSPQAHRCFGSASFAARIAAAWRASNTGRSERMGGNERKLWCGGGEVVHHSRELAPQGSFGWSGGRRSARKTATRNGIVPSARMTLPTVDTTLSV